MTEQNPNHNHKNKNKNSDPDGSRDSSGEKKGRLLWIIVAAFSLFWVFLPEITDTIPVIGWLDEGFAAGAFLYALSRLGVNIPILTDYINRRVRQNRRR